MQRFKNILCVVGPGDDGRRALERALTLANNNQARLIVVEVVDEIPPNTTLMERTLSPVDLQGILVAEHQEKLQALVTSLNNNIEIKARILIGDPFLEVIRDVLRSGFDLVIKMAESGGHDEIKIKIFKMRFGQTQNYRGACGFRCVHNALQKVQADEVKGTYGITVLIGVLQHILHINQWHDYYLYIIFPFWLYQLT